jgi:hypothetical protein
LKGPLPAALVLSASMPPGSTIEIVWSRSVISGETFLKVMVAVPASSALTPSTPATAGSMLNPRSLSAAFSKFLTMSSATSSLPLWNLTPFRRFSVTAVPSWEIVHLSARPGSGVSLWP